MTKQKDSVYVNFDMAYVDKLAKCYMSRNNIPMEKVVSDGEIKYKTPDRVTTAVLHVLGVDLTGKRQMFESVIRDKKNKLLGRKTTILSALIRADYPYVSAYKEHFGDMKDIITSDDISGEMIELSDFGLSYYTSLEKEFTVA